MVSNLVNNSENPMYVPPHPSTDIVYEPDLRLGDARGPRDPKVRDDRLCSFIEEGGGAAVVQSVTARRMI